MRSGRYSCRSVCYLAAGRPVVVQDTGFAVTLSVGEGILPFTAVEDAIAAIHAVEGNYARNRKATAAIAEEYFDSDKILNRPVEDALCGNTS